MSAKPEGGKDAYTRDRLQEIGKVIDELLPDGWGFFLMSFPLLDREGRCNYIANARREDILKVMQNFINQNKGGEMFQHHTDGKL